MATLALARNLFSHFFCNGRTTGLNHLHVNYSLQQQTVSIVQLFSSAPMIELGLEETQPLPRELSGSKYRDNEGSF